LANIVSIKLTVGIPSEAVYFSFIIGGTFNGGVKCGPSATLDLEKPGPDSLKVAALSWGTTHRYADADALTIAGQPDWFRRLKTGAQPSATATLERTAENLSVSFATLPGATHAVEILVKGGNPLLTGSPAIDAQLTVGLRKTSGAIEYCVVGEHDGFPNYNLQLNSKSVYAWDALQHGETPLALGGLVDVDVDIGWRKL
jgi:hypothetical protein